MATNKEDEGETVVDYEQDEMVKKLSDKLAELKKQRIKVDETNEMMRKKIEKLAAHLDDLDEKYGKERQKPSNSAQKTGDGKTE